jgi:hypothetical protein
MRTTISRRTTFGAAIAVPVAWQLGRAHAETPGNTPNEIRIGNTIPYSGRASAYGTMGHLESAFFKMVTETGGVDGRSISSATMTASAHPRRWKTFADWLKKIVSHSFSACLARRLIPLLWKV